VRAQPVCLVPGCPTVAHSRGRCAEHEAAREQQRGTRQQRGYDAQHERTRRRLMATAVGTACPLCGEMMTEHDRLELDHTTPLKHDRRSRGDRIVHGTCNAREGGRLNG
jgi:hypothetical protein